jgi:hypothetical protein
MMNTLRLARARSGEKSRLAPSPKKRWFTGILTRGKPWSEADAMKLLSILGLLLSKFTIDVRYPDILVVEGNLRHEIVNLAARKMGRPFPRCISREDEFAWAVAEAANYQMT